MSFGLLLRLSRTQTHNAQTAFQMCAILQSLNLLLQRLLMCSDLEGFYIVGNDYRYFCLFGKRKGKKEGA